jgi:hypothetical protein
MNLDIIFSKLGLSVSAAQDVTLFLVVALFSFIFGIFIGRYKLITILINMYVAVAIMSMVPAKIATEYSFKLIGFFAIIIILTLIGKKMFEIYISGSGSGFLWRVFVMSFLEVVFLISYVLAIIPKKLALGYVSPSAYGYLASENARLFWTVLPLVFMFIIHKKLNR